MKLIKEKGKEEKGKEEESGINITPKGKLNKNKKVT